MTYANYREHWRKPNFFPTPIISKSGWFTLFSSFGTRVRLTMAYRIVLVCEFTIALHKEVERVLEIAMTLFYKWRSTFVVMVIMATLAVGLTQTQAADVEWETRFNH